MAANCLSTVSGTLRSVADLRCPQPATRVERSRAVEGSVLELGLRDCADTRTRPQRAVVAAKSGELVLGPFLDEVTTGLDSSSAFQLISTLKSLAIEGRTVVTTIHQPRPEIWRLFRITWYFFRVDLLYTAAPTGQVPCLTLIA